MSQSSHGNDYGYSCKAWGYAGDPLFSMEEQNDFNLVAIYSEGQRAGGVKGNAWKHMLQCLKPGDKVFFKTWKCLVNAEKPGNLSLDVRKAIYELEEKGCHAHFLDVGLGTEKDVDVMVFGIMLEKEQFDARKEIAAATKNLTLTASCCLPTSSGC